MNPFYVIREDGRTYLLDTETRTVSIIAKGNPRVKVAEVKKGIEIERIFGQLKNKPL